MLLVNVLNSKIRFGIGFILCVALLVGCHYGGAGTETLSGTAAQGAPIVNSPITIKDKYGSKIIGATGSDGNYKIDVTGKSAPFLLQIPIAGGGNLYSVATETGTVNIHPFSDLIIRNWYKVRGYDVEVEFVKTGPLEAVPTAIEINPIESAVRHLLHIYLASVGVPILNFNLLTSVFEANHAGFDKVLDNTKVEIINSKISDVFIIFNSTKVTVSATDPVTGLSGIMASFNISSNLGTNDTELPSVPTNLRVIPADMTKVTLVWSVSTDNVGVAGYSVYRNGAKISVSPSPVYLDTGLTANTQYCYSVEAFDGTGNLSNIRSAESCVTTLSNADTTPPSAPVLTATPTSDSRIFLSWTASSDDIGVIGYYIQRSTATLVGTSAINYTDTGLSEVSQYCYSAKAIDAALNTSVESNLACTTTLPVILPRTLAGSCSVGSSLCIAYVGAYYSSAMIYAARSMSPCAISTTNVWSTGYCPITNAVGHCYNSVASSRQTDTYYYSPLAVNSTVSTLQAACDMEGTWFYLP